MDNAAVLALKEQTYNEGYGRALFQQIEQAAAQTELTTCRLWHQLHVPEGLVIIKPVFHLHPVAGNADNTLWKAHFLPGFQHSVGNKINTHKMLENIKTAYLHKHLGIAQKVVQTERLARDFKLLKTLQKDTAHQLAAVAELPFAVTRLSHDVFAGMMPRRLLTIEFEDNHYQEMKYLVSDIMHRQHKAVELRNKLEGQLSKLDAPVLDRHHGMTAVIRKLEAREHVAIETRHPDFPIVILSLRPDDRLQVMGEFGKELINYSFLEKAVQQETGNKNRAQPQRNTRPRSAKRRATSKSKHNLRS